MGMEWYGMGQNTTGMLTENERTWHLKKNLAKGHNIPSQHGMIM